MIADYRFSARQVEGTKRRMSDSGRVYRRLLATQDNRKVSGGWPRVLSSMKSFVETGYGLNVFGGL